MADCIPSARDHLDKMQKMQERLNLVAQSGANTECADCCAPYPTWASLLEPAYEGGKRMGLLCCFQCYSYHFQLGKDICEVKSIKIAADWTEEDIQVIQETGNQLVNDAYEAKLKDLEDNEKEAAVLQKQGDRERFIPDKYKHRIYFIGKICDRATDDRRCRQRKRAKGLKSRSPCPNRRKVPARSVSSDEVLCSTSGHRRKTPTRAFSLDDELCSCDGPSLDGSPTPSKDGDRRRLDSKRSSSSRHLGEGRPAPPSRSHSSANIDKGGRDDSDHPGRPRISKHSDQERNTRPKVQRAASSRDGMFLKKQSSLRVLDIQSSHGFEKNHRSMSHIMYDFEGEGDIDQSSVPVRKESSAKESETIPTCSGHGGRRRKKRTTSPMPRRRAGSCTGRRNPAHGADEASENRSESSSSMVNKGVDLPVTSDHGEKGPMKRAENVASAKERRQEIIRVVDEKAGIDNISHHSVISSSSSSSSTKENGIPSSSGHSEKRPKKRSERKGKRSELLHQADSGGIDSVSHHSVRPIRSSAAKGSDIPSSSGHSEKRKRGELKSERRGLPERTVSTSSGKRTERRGSLGYGQPGDRRGSLGHGQPADRRGSLGHKRPGDKRGSLGHDQPSLGHGRPRRRRNSMDHKNIPDSVGDQEIELPTAEERQSWNHSKLDKIAARRQKGRLGGSVTTLEWQPESQPLEPTEDVEPDTLLEDVPSREELGYGDDAHEEAHEKKKTSWKKKLVKLAKGGKSDKKNKGDKAAAEESATSTHSPTGTDTIPPPEQPQNSTALVA